MKVINNCPICNKILTTNSGVHQKWCSGDEGHTFWCRLSYDRQNVMEIELCWDNMPIIDWDFEEQSLYAGRYTSSEIQLPFFDFDVDNMPKLLEKLKTYLVFA